MAELLRVITLRELPESQVVMEYGEQGDEFFLLLDGWVEVIKPDKNMLDEFNTVRSKVKAIMHSINSAYNDVHSYDQKRAKITKRITAEA